MPLASVDSSQDRSRHRCYQVSMVPDQTMHQNRVSSQQIFMCVWRRDSWCCSESDSLTHFIRPLQVLSWSKYHHMQSMHTQREHLSQQTPLFWMFSNTS